MVIIKAQYSSPKSSNSGAQFKVLQLFEEDKHGQVYDITYKVNKAKNYSSPEELLEELGFDPANTKYKFK